VQKATEVESTQAHNPNQPTMETEANRHQRGERGDATSQNTQKKMYMILQQPVHRERQ